MCYASRRFPRCGGAATLQHASSLVRTRRRRRLRDPSSREARWRVRRSQFTAQIRTMPLNDNTETSQTPILPARVRHMLLLMLAEIDGCAACRDHHAAAARRFGCTGLEIEAARRSQAHEMRSEMALRYVAALHTQPFAAPQWQYRLQGCGFTSAQLAALDDLLGIARHGHVERQVDRRR